MQKLGHEKLRVYQLSIQYTSWAQNLLAGIDSAAAVLDHFDRASESIPDNLANGNSRRDRADRNRFFDASLGSGLESAACLDVCLCKNLMSAEQNTDGKEQLARIVRMIMRLREAPIGRVAESCENYETGNETAKTNLFHHEQLDVYHIALDLVRWVDILIQSPNMKGRYSSRLDKHSTAVVLNIAEGNGRFSSLDHRRFIDIAYTSAMRTAATLDIMATGEACEQRTLAEGKELLIRLVPLIMGLRGYWDQSSQE